MIAAQAELFELMEVLSVKICNVKYLTLFFVSQHSFQHTYLQGSKSSVLNHMQQLKVFPGARIKRIFITILDFSQTNTSSFVKIIFLKWINLH